MYYELLELAKKNSFLKKIGKKVLKLQESYFRFIADEEFFSEYQKEYLELPGCKDGHVNSISVQYVKGNIRLIDRKLVLYYDELWEEITQKIKEKKGYTLVRMGDGEINFLRGIVKGNTANRHFTKEEKPSREYLAYFKQNLLACDSIHVEMYKSVYKHSNDFFGKNIFSPIPLECVYGLVASKKIFNPQYKIGIIGSEKKIEIIKELLKFSEYREYLGRDTFESYIPVPERGSSNNVKELSKEIASKLDPSIDMYLVGVGVAKLAMLAELKKHSNAVFIDVGCGISALAGLVSNTRPYFADWVNYRLKGYDYSSVDVIDADMGKGGTQYL